jgi:hypothetical protein
LQLGLKKRNYFYLHKIEIHNINNNKSNQKCFVSLKSSIQNGIKQQPNHKIGKKQPTKQIPPDINQVNIPLSLSTLVIIFMLHLGLKIEEIEIIYFRIIIALKLKLILTKSCPAVN